MISIDEAFSFVEQHVKPLAVENTAMRDAVGLVLAEDIFSDVNAPPHDKSVMDGFAVRSQDVAGSGQEFRITETIIAGSMPTKSISKNEVARIMTGAPLPAGADAVVMVELTDFDPAKPESVALNVERVDSGKHIMKKAVTLSVGDRVFQKGHVIRPTDIGLLAESGGAMVPTRRYPTMAVLPTGNELVDCSQLPGEGQIRNSNGPMLIAMAHGLGLTPVDLGIGRDEEGPLTEKIKRGLNHDLLVLSGGVSAGLHDLVPGILSKLGVREVFHKVKVKPGKPIWFGIKEHEDRPPTYVFGLPGNPVSSLIGFQLFVRAAIRKLMGCVAIRPQSVSAVLAAPHQTRGDRPVYWPGQVVIDDEVTRSVQPLEWLGSSDLTALGKADCLIYFSADEHEHAAGKKVEIYSIV